jgi:MFS family permease
MAPVTFASLLKRNAPFRWLWSGQIVSEMGNWFSFIAELSLARAMSGTAWAATGVTVSRLLPFCVLGPVAGAIADRYPRRAILIGADVARAVVSLGFFLVTTPERMWIAYLCCAVMAALTAFFDAAKNASLPNLARAEELLPATALMHATRFLQMTLGAALGGVTSDALGYKVAFAVNAVSFLVSAACVARIPEEKLHAEGHAGVERTRSPRVLAADLAAAFSLVRRSPLILGIVLLNFGWALGGGMISVIHDRFGGVIFAAPGRSGDRGVAVLYAAAGAGLWLGMVASRRVGVWVGRRERIGPFIGWATAAAAVVFAASGLMPNLWLMALLIAVNRLLLGVEFAIQETVLMNALPDAMRGKVFTIDRSIEVAVMAISAGIGGVLFAVLPPPAVPLIAGLLMVVPGIGWLLALGRGALFVPRGALGASAPAGD